MASLTITPAQLPGAAIITTHPYRDERGSFHRFFSSQEMAVILQSRTIHAINYSVTQYKGTIRGLHFQRQPHSETKMVRCLKGKVYDVMVDLRPTSPTYLQWQAEILTNENQKMLFIPEGFAHGFQALEDDSELLYLHTAHYEPDFEAGIRFDDPELNIPWPLAPANISPRDSNLKMLDSIKGSLP